MGRYSFLFAFLIAGLPTVSLAEECITFRRLVPAFTTELSLRPKKAKIFFQPLNLGAETGAGARPAYLLQDLDSCGMLGDCDSMLYLRVDGKCYRPVLTFRGKWKGLYRRSGRELASLRIESRFEGDTVVGKSVLRIERRLRSFDFFPSSKYYMETK